MLLYIYPHLIIIYPQIQIVRIISVQMDVCPMSVCNNTLSCGQHAFYTKEIPKLDANIFMGSVCLMQYSVTAQVFVRR